MQRLSELRRARGLSQRQLARRLGVGLRSLVAWERGEREPRLGPALVMAKVLGVRIEQLVGSEAPSSFWAESISFGAMVVPSAEPGLKEWMVAATEVERAFGRSVVDPPRVHLARRSRDRASVRVRERWGTPGNPPWATTQDAIESAAARLRAFLGVPGAGRWEMPSVLARAGLRVRGVPRRLRPHVVTASWPGRGAALEFAADLTPHLRNEACLLALSHLVIRRGPLVPSEDVRADAEERFADVPPGWTVQDRVARAIALPAPEIEPDVRGWIRSDLGAATAASVAARFGVTPRTLLRRAQDLGWVRPRVVDAWTRRHDRRIGAGTDGGWRRVGGAADASEASRWLAVPPARVRHAVRAGRLPADLAAVYLGEPLAQPEPRAPNQSAGPGFRFQ